jgi:bifunctional non-homologous end joining protein LigD
LEYYAFDLLELNRRSWMERPLYQRRRQLASVARGSSQVLPSLPLPGRLPDIERRIRLFGLEGIVAKRRGSLYRPGERSRDWLKVRFSPRQEFVVGGYRPSASGFESLLIGYYNDGELHFAGQVREGFTKRSRALLMDRLPRRPVACPFVDLPHHLPYRGRHPWDQRITGVDMATYRWVAPSVVAEFAYLGWTRHQLLRQGRFLGVRDDKTAHSVQRE